MADAQIYTWQQVKSLPKRHKDGLVYIYKLVHPDTRAVIYVGQTTAPRDRFKAHYHAAHGGRELSSQKDLQALICAWRFCNFEIVRVVTKADANVAEQLALREARVEDAPANKSVFSKKTLWARFAQRLIQPPILES